MNKYFDPNMKITEEYIRSLNPWYSSHVNEDDVIYFWEQNNLFGMPLSVLVYIASQGFNSYFTPIYDDISEYTETDANGNITLSVNITGYYEKSNYDSDGNLTYIESGTLDDENEFVPTSKIHNEYNSDRNLVLVKDLIGNYVTERYEYDANGNRVYEYYSSVGDEGDDKPIVIEHVECWNEYNSKGILVKDTTIDYIDNCETVRIFSEEDGDIVKSIYTDLNTLETTTVKDLTPKQNNCDSNGNVLTKNIKTKINEDDGQLLKYGDLIIPWFEKDK